MTEILGLGEVRRPPRVFATIVFALGGVLGAGGLWLAELGGSLYYVIAGVGLMASAVMFWRGRYAGIWLYGGVFLGTLAWALWEVGFDVWGLMPRLLLLGVLGAWLVLPRTRRGLV